MQTGVVGLVFFSGRLERPDYPYLYMRRRLFFFGFEYVYYLSFCGTINYVQRRSETFF